MVFVWSHVLLVPFLFIYSLFSLTSTTCFPQIQPKCHEYESHALLQFKQDFDINKSASVYPLSYPKTISWNSSTNCCSWDGITCDEHTNLTSLHELCLYNSDLYCEFPIGVFHLPNLELLDLRNNPNLKGSLLEFQSSPLTKLRLDETGFYGTLPLSIGKLTSLNILSISHCHFSGYIPSSLGNLTQPKNISLEYNNFRGDPLASLANLTKLSHLYVGFNEFTIETISWIGKLSSIVVLDISSVNISSDIPLPFVNLTQLEVLSSKNSNIKGEFPSWIMNLTNLANLAVRSNFLHGKLDLGMFLKLKKLDFLNLSFNKLSLSSGKSSSNVTDSKIQVLQLALCNLVEIPTFIRDLNDLECLVLSHNSITSQSNWLWRKTSLQILTVSNGSLTGEISPYICNLKSLVHLDLSFNNLTGNVPTCMGNFSQSLENIILKDKKLSGLIPHT